MNASFEKNESSIEKLERLLGEMAAEMNDDLSQYSDRDEGQIVNDDCTLNMLAWQKGKHGPYDKVGDIKMDKQFIAERDLVNSGAVGKVNQDSILDHYHQQKREGHGNLLEMAITSILYKVLHDQFIVVRASQYDDYANGVDNVIVNKETGDVVCAFDEVRDDQSGERFEKKVNKVRDIAKKGGTEIKYGLTIDKQSSPELVKKQIDNIPVFYLAVDRDHLLELLEKMDYSKTSISEIEKSVYDNLIVSLEQQIALLLDENLPENIQNNIQSFQESLETMRRLMEKIA
ncbi:MAG: hypothetical protein CO073_01505 [Candidatus Komeilibacteria bacterium CG_4_9_14_0_8_um_filter_36_9]|nr:MAG: hypothetical protein CO073_01505 [Candidatus Komeilibacteria bacterium CG_4_9_14_0_8_um_filter_36_9]